MGNYPNIINIVDQLPHKAWEIGHRTKPPTTITIHHNGPPTSVTRDAQMPAFLKVVANYHMRDGWAGVAGGADGIMYHYSVGPEGSVFQMRNDINQLWHCGVREGNENGLAIFLPIGEGQVPTIAMQNSLFSLLHLLLRRYRLPIAATRIHKDWKSTDCPGDAVTAVIQLWRSRVDVMKPSDSLFTKVPTDFERVCTSIMATPTGEYNEYDICDVIIPGYFEIAEKAGIYPLFPITQMIHETWNMRSFWAGRPRRNPAGIGVTGTKVVLKPADTTNWAYNPTTKRWEAGNSYARWSPEAITSHIGRLLAYSLKDGEGTVAQQELIAKALQDRPLPADKRGTVKKFTDLNGNWAVPGTVYAQAIVKIANTIY